VEGFPSKERLVLSLRPGCSREGLRWNRYIIGGVNFHTLKRYQRLSVLRDHAIDAFWSLVPPPVPTVLYRIVTYSTEYHGYPRDGCDLRSRYLSRTGTRHALELYREVAMVGAVVERKLARERIVDIARERQRVFNNPPPVLMGGPVAPAAEGNKHAVNLPDQTLSRLDTTRCFVSEFVDGEGKMREKT
jgi:hypothetical protein